MGEATPAGIAEQGLRRVDTADRNTEMQGGASSGRREKWAARSAPAMGGNNKRRGAAVINDWSG